MKKRHILIFLSIAAILVCTGLTNAAAKPAINEIRFESPSKNADQIIFVLNGPHLPKGKALPGENPRVYFDFPDTTPSNKVKTRMAVSGNFIKQIRYAFHKTPTTKTRVVFDLVANQKMEFKQDFNPNTNTLVITLYRAGTDPEPYATVLPPPTQETTPEPAPEPTPEMKTEPEIAKEPVSIFSQPEPASAVTEKPAVPELPAKEVKKQIQPVEDISIDSIPEKPEITIPEPKVEVEKQVTEIIQEAPAPPPEIAPVEKSIPEPEKIAEPEASQKDKMPVTAAIVPSPKAPDMLEKQTDEATLIQPMSEVGVQEKEAAGESTPVLREIEFDPKSNRGEIISFKLNGFHPPVVFGIEEDIPRIVCFFKNASAGNNLRDMIETNGRYVKNIKIGKYKNPENIRVVLELVPGNNYDLQQIFFKDDKVFMMIINKAGKQASSQGS